MKMKEGKSHIIKAPNILRKKLLQSQSRFNLKFHIFIFTGISRHATVRSASTSGYLLPVTLIIIVLKLMRSVIIEIIEIKISIINVAIIVMTIIVVIVIRIVIIVIDFTIVTIVLIVHTIVIDNIAIISIHLVMMMM